MYHDSINDVSRDLVVLEHIEEFLYPETVRFLKSIVLQPGESRKDGFSAMYAEPETFDEIDHRLDEEEAR